MWFEILGVNLNLRKVLRHVEFEPNTYYTAFSVELEAASAPLWSFINACKSMVRVLALIAFISLKKVVIKQVDKRQPLI